MRSFLAGATLLLGAVVAFAVSRSQPDVRDVLAAVQLAISVLVPFFGVLAVTGPGRGLAPRLLSALALAAGFALAGVLEAAVAARAWPAASLVVASVLVQLIAQLVGTGFGLLIRRPAVAMAATIVVPMSVTIVLTAVDTGGGLVRWLTPFGNARSLLAGDPSAAILVVVLLWCVVPNTLGARQRRG